MDDSHADLIKAPAVAGMFYPADPVRLERQVSEYLEQARQNVENSKAGSRPPIRALIVPHAGYEYSGPVAAAAYRAITDARYNKVIVLGLSHQVWFDGIALCPYAFWQTPLGKVELVQLQFKTDPRFQADRAAFAGEHSVEVQLPFLQKVLPELRVAALLTGVVKSTRELAAVLAGQLGPDDLLIVSSDLSHYHPYTEAQGIDSGTITQILSLDDKIDHEQACGADGINILLSIAKERNWKPRLLDYRNSGDTAGDKTQVVGYTALEFS